MRGVFILGWLIILVGVACAQGMDSYGVDYQINEDRVYVLEKFEFADVQNLTDFELILPFDVRDVKLYVDGKKTDELISGRKIRVEYNTKEFIEEKKRFLTSFRAPFFTKLIKIRVILPEGAVLAKSVENSVFPYPSDVSSDGRRIFVEWVKEDVDKGEDFSFFVNYKKGFNENYLGYIIAGVIGFSLFIVYLYLLKKKATKEKKKKRQDKHKFEEHLKEDEEQVMNILKKKGGECEQSTLVVISDFSKAKMSRILQELEERKIVKKITKGRKNIIILKGKR